MDLATTAWVAEQYESKSTCIYHLLRMFQDVRVYGVLAQHDAGGVLDLLGDVRDGRLRQVRPLLPVLLRRKHVLHLPVLRRLQGLGLHRRLTGTGLARLPE